MHLDEEQIQHFMHGEVAPPAEASVRGHLAACAHCRRRVAEAEREEDEVHALLGRLDHPPPRIDADAIAATARAHRVDRGRWAAGVLLALGAAGAAYATPGSPLPRWLDTVVAWWEAPPDPSVSAPSPSQTPEPGVAGIRVAPGQALVILFASPGAEGHARVSLSAGAEVVVRALNGAVTFTSAVDRLAIDSRGAPATFEIRIPRDAPRVEIRVGSRRVFLKEGPRVTTDAPASASGIYLLPLNGTGP